MPYQDISKTGPQNWRELQQQNFDLEASKQRIANVLENAPTYTPNLNYSDLDLRGFYGEGIPNIYQNPEYGKSRYDEVDPTLSNYFDYQDLRGQKQSGFKQIANGVLKGVITTATTYVDLLAGIPVGIVTAVAEGRLAGLWDNAVTNAMQSVTDWSEEVLPNYYTSHQQATAWYDPSNLFSANFLGDKLIKNFGFSLGAGLGMKTVSRIPKLLPKLIKNANIARAVATAATSFVGAVGEGSIEALNGTREWANQNRDLIEQERSQSKAALDLKYSQLEKDILAQYGNTEIAQKLVLSLMSDYQKEANQIDALANTKIAKLQDQIDTQGNLILAGNIPILWGSNILTLGKMIARGYDAAEHSLGRYVRRATTEGGRLGYESTLTSARQALRYVKTPVLEGLEEMNQAVISTAAKNRAQDYYNMSIDPDATEATKSYMGYLWDALGQTYGDIDNYEEFVIGMLSSGISDIVVGQGKALRKERRQLNEAVARANEIVNNFNNRTLLQNMNRQQVLEDQKLDAALRNDKKEYKDSEFGQIASAVVTFSQIGKIEDLKAMLDANLSNLTDEELDNLASQLSQKDDTGTETNAFTLMTNEQRREYLKKQKDTYEKTIDDYNKIKDDLISETGTLFSPEQQAELIFYRLRANNANDRINDIDKEIETIITNSGDRFWTQQKDLAKKLNLPDRAINAQDVINAIKEFKGSNKALAEIFKDTQRLSQLFTDKDRLQADIDKYNNIVLDFIANPQRLEQKNSKLRNKVNNFFTARKVKRVLPEFEGVNTFSEFTKTLQAVDPKLQKAVLDELIKQGNVEAKSFADKTTFARYIASTLDAIEADEFIKDRAAQLILESIDKQTLNATKDLDNPLYSRENNSDLNDNEYDELYNTLANTIGKADQEVNSSITEDAPIRPESQTKQQSAEDVSDEEFYSSFMNQTAEQAQASLDEDEKALSKSTKELTTDGAILTVGTDIHPENTTILNPPAVGTNNINLADIKPEEDNRQLGSKPLTTTNPLKEFTRMGMGIKEVDTKEKSDTYGIPLIKQTDKDGNKTKLAKELTPIYNRLKELNTFENLNNGAVKSSSIITFALDTTMKGDHVVDGETITYDEPAVLLYVGDKCVGNLSKSDANSIGILANLKEEFKDKSSNNPMLSQKYYTTVETIEHGIVKFTNTWNILKESDLDSIKERMANENTSKEEIIPIIAVYDANSGAFVRGNEKFQIGNQIGPTFYSRFYKGRAVLLIPTAAYDSNADSQPKKAFVPVGLNRIRANQLDRNSQTYNELRNLIKQIFKADCTTTELNTIVGKIKSLITYNYHLSDKETQEVFIDPAFPARNDDGSIKVDEKGNIILTSTTNHSWFAKNKKDPAQGKFAYLKIKWKRADGQVWTAAIMTHEGNVESTQSFNDEVINTKVDDLMKIFLEDLNAYVNINKTRLTDPQYINQLINEGVLQTNAEELKVIGNNFTITPKVFERKNNEVITQSDAKQNTNQQQSSNDKNNTNVTFDTPNFDDDDFGLFRRETQRTTSEVIDINKEVDKIMKMLPQLDRNKVFKIVNHLIKINDKSELAMGQFNRGIIILSNIAEAGTAYHEAFHLVFNMLLDNNERNALFEEYQTKYPTEIKLQLEERMAEDFRDFMMTRESRSLGQKVLDFFKDLLNVILYKTNHKMTFNTISSRIWQGKYANRELSDTNNLRNRTVTADPNDYVLNQIQQIFENFQNKNGYALGTFTITKKDANGKTVQFDRPKYIKQLIVQENGRYYINMGLTYDKYAEGSKKDKMISNIRYVNKKPIDVFNDIVNRLGLKTKVHTVELETNYVDIQGNPIYRYEVIIDNFEEKFLQEIENNPTNLPLEVLKDIQSGNFTKTAEELYEEQSDPLNKKDLCGYRN